MHVRQKKKKRKRAEQKVLGAVGVRVGVVVRAGVVVRVGVWACGHGACAGVRVSMVRVWACGMARRGRAEYLQTGQI